MIPKLGKKPVRHDPRTLRLAKYLAPQLPPPANALDFSAAIAARGISIGMLANDAEGDCVIAAMMHMITTWRANAGETLVGTDAEADANYRAAWADQNPLQSFQDTGLEILAFLKFMVSTGIVVGGQAHKIGAFCSVAAQNPGAVASAMGVGIGVLMGVNLPLCAQAQTASGVWDVQDGPDGQPGSWGGHGINGVKYVLVQAVGMMPAGLLIDTWGQTVLMTWAAVGAWCDEMYCLFSTDILNAQGVSPEGLDAATMLADQAAIGDLPPQVAPIAPDPAAKTLLIVIATGLFTDPTGSDDCGMLELAQQIAAAHPDYTPQYIRIAWDADNPNAQATALMNQILASKASKIIFLAHSFGGAFAIFFAQWLYAWYSGPAHDAPPFTIDAFILFDPCPNVWRFGSGQGVGWAVPVVIAPKQLCFVQRNGPLGIAGVPLESAEVNTDVTSDAAPTLGHCDWLWPTLTCLIRDARVQGQVLAWFAPVFSSVGVA